MRIAKKTHNAIRGDMTNKIQSIAIEKFIAHPDNPNRMSKGNFTKLLRNIKRTGRYEPLVVRPAADSPGCFQIINGHHRCWALRQLGYKRADAIVWDVDDKEADILLATLNRLEGSDVLAKKIALLARLNERYKARELAKLLPSSARQIERLTSMVDFRNRPVKAHKPGVFTQPIVFFLNEAQRDVVERALSLAGQDLSVKTKAAKNAAALTSIAQRWLMDDG